MTKGKPVSRSELAIAPPRRFCFYAVPMTSDELLEVLAATPGTHRVPVDAPLTAGILVAGIEITTTKSASEQTLRKLWRDRRGGGATPLRLLADDPARPGCVSALGTVDAAGPLRSVEAGALSDVVQRLAGRPRLEAARELTGELDRLQGGASPDSSFVTSSPCTPSTCVSAMIPFDGQGRRR